jgi:hypothetical protein
VAASETDGDDFLGFAGLFQANGLFDRDLVERVHRHLEVGKIDTRAVGLHTGFQVVVDHALHWHENLHDKLLSRKPATR